MSNLLASNLGAGALVTVSLTPAAGSYALLVVRGDGTRANAVL